MGSKTYAKGGVLVPSEHHIAAFHGWIQEEDADGSYDRSHVVVQRDCNRVQADLKFLAGLHICCGPRRSTASPGLPDW